MLDWAAGRVFLQSDIKEAATAMYREFQEHGGAAFCPETSGAMLSEGHLLAATSPTAAGSTGSRAQAGDDSATGNSEHTLRQPHAEQGQGRTRQEGTAHSSSTLHQADAATGTSRAVTAPDHNGSSITEQSWPPDIQWLPANPLVCLYSTYSAWQHSVIPFCVASLCGGSRAVLLHLTFVIAVS